MSQRLKTPNAVLTNGADVDDKELPVTVEDSLNATSFGIDEEARLMLAAQANDVFAFEELTTRNQGRVYAYLQRFVGDPQLAEDLAQEVFMRVYKHRATYRQEARFSTWLFRIAHNVAYNALRTKSRRPETLFNSAAGQSSGDSTQFEFEENILTRSGSTPTQKVARLEKQAIVRDAVQKLPPRQRQAVLLSRFEGMSYQQIADVMATSQEAVKSILCRAHKNLKEILTPFIEEGKRPK